MRYADSIGNDPDLAVADLAGSRRRHEPSTTTLRVVVVDEDLEPDLRHEVDGVLRAAVHLGVAALATEALHFRNGEALHAEPVERVLDVADLERLDDRHDELHAAPPSQIRSRA